VFSVRRLVGVASAWAWWASFILNPFALCEIKNLVSFFITINLCNEALRG
jgi:hypothetical protein